MSGRGRGTVAAAATPAPTMPAPPTPAPSPVPPTGAPPTLEQRLERQAYALGFDLVGLARLGPAETAGHFDDWIAKGRHGDMAYMARDPGLRHDTTRPHPGAVSAVVVGMDYGGREPSGPVARYARGDDYHDVMKERLRALHAWLSEAVGHEVDGRAYVDTAPILERDLARRAGLGWFGKNTLLINPARGSYFFLGSLFVALDLAPSAPFAGDKCGGCTRCLKACPTQALVAPRALDATRCISYLTIENKGAIPEDLRDMVGSWLYGCDVCQEVCPWNVKFGKALSEGSPYAPREALGEPDARTLARTLLAMSQAEFARAFQGSPMKRAKLRGLKRNAAVVLGNVGTADDAEALASACDDADPLLREHAEWALARVAQRRP
ncbi:MAG TPA: tRNA epoxyqueuosine(34) reductase QueG [Gemmatimonadaceae bacterium]|nr:tRNA epoxyqueuosine(34) reductase QueG [Gemmatimonadaceae bacterium]